MERENAERFLEALTIVCRNYGASLFFGDASAALWMNGEDHGRIADTDEGQGQTFEFVAEAHGYDSARGDA